MRGTSEIWGPVLTSHDQNMRSVLGAGYQRNLEPAITGPTTGPTTGAITGPTTGPITGPPTGLITGPTTGPTTGPLTGPNQPGGL